MDYLYIGDVRIERTAALAPMASVADYAYRAMAKDFGAAYLVGEMASAKGLCYNDRKTEELLSVEAEERPMAIQLFGSEPEFIAQAARIAARFKPDIIDLNAGCPVPKVAGNGAGSALMKDPALLGRVVRAAASAGIPVTVKIRSGWDEDHINAVECAYIAEKNGAAAIAVHPRTRNQMYSGKADRSVIAAVKKAVSVPVIGNGDVDSVESCLEMYRKTGCDLVMIGRGSMGRPWLFSQIKAALNGEPVPPEPTALEKIDIMRRHIALLIKSKGESVAMREARAAAAHYLKGFPNAAAYRARCGGLTTRSDFDEMCRALIAENG